MIMDVTLILPECMYGCEDCIVTHQYKAKSGRMMYMCQYYAERFGFPQYLEPVTPEEDVAIKVHMECCGQWFDSVAETLGHECSVDEEWIYTPSGECPNCGGTISVNGDRYPSESPRALICEECELVYA